MKAQTIAVATCLLVFINAAAFAQSAACEGAIKKKYSGAYSDRYGNQSSKRIDMLQYYVTQGPGMHKFGQNDAHFYLAVVDNYEGNRITGRDTVKVWCVVNSAGKVLGLEREFD